MKKMTGNLENFSIRVGHIFPKKENTFQEAFLIYLCDSMFPPFLSVTEKSIIRLKEKYLRWQSKEFPTTTWITNKYSEWLNIGKFSHDDDFSWNDLEEKIVEYIVSNVEEIGCHTYQQSLIQEMLDAPIDFGDGILL